MVAVEELVTDIPVGNGGGEAADVFAVLKVEPKMNPDTLLLRGRAERSAEPIPVRRLRPYVMRLERDTRTSRPGTPPQRGISSTREIHRHFFTHGERDARSNRVAFFSPQTIRHY